MTRNFRMGGWEIEGEDYFIRMDEATYLKHRDAYLKGLGIETRSWLQLQEEIQRKSQQQLEASKALDDPAFWLEIDDPQIHKYHYNRIYTRKP